MPYKTAPDKKIYEPSDLLPLHLAHKPIYSFPYEQFDGHFVGDTDARYISVGQAQYDLNDISIKMFRHTGEKWTRQSEEIPLHRIIDMVIFLTKVLNGHGNDLIEIEPYTFENQKQKIEITEDMQNGDEYISEFLSRDNGKQRIMLQKRLEILRKELSDINI